MGELTRGAGLLAAVVLLAGGCTCACACAARSGATDALASDVLPRDTSRDQGVDRRRDLWLREAGADGPMRDAAPLPACGGSRKLTPTPITPYAPLACGTGCEQITFGRWVELDYQVSGDVVVYSSLLSGAFFSIQVLDLKSRKEVQLSKPAPYTRTCPRLATDGVALVTACGVLGDTSLGKVGRFSVSRIDLGTFLETDILCRDIPVATGPCIAEALATSSSMIALGWNPGACGARPHVLPLAGGALVQLSAARANRMAISGDRVVWQAANGTYGAIFLHDLTTGTQAPVSPGAGDQGFAKIEGDQIVWVDTRNGPKKLLFKGNHDIYHYDLTTHKETAITMDAAVQFEPDVSGDWVVWEDWRNTPGGDPSVSDANSDIYAYNLKTKTEVQLTDFPGRELSPRVDKGRVFYRKLDGKGQANLFMIDLAQRLGTK